MKSSLHRKKKNGPSITTCTERESARERERERARARERESERARERESERARERESERGNQSIKILYQEEVEACVSCAASCGVFVTGLSAHVVSVSAHAHTRTHTYTHTFTYTTRTCTRAAFLLQVYPLTL
jgi:uncharacterized membrane protein YdbT with pleckstrin-like domain